jgi:hypothetical protein
MVVAKVVTLRTARAKGLAARVIERGALAAIHVIAICRDVYSPGADLDELECFGVVSLLKI